MSAAAHVDAAIPEQDGWAVLMHGTAVLFANNAEKQRGGSPGATHRVFTEEKLKAYGDDRERALLARLGEQQPVLWQWRWKDTQGPWSDVKSSDGLRDKAAFEYRPLYAHPPAAQPVMPAVLLGLRDEFVKLGLWRAVDIVNDTIAAQPVAQGARADDLASGWIAGRAETYADVYPNVTPAEAYQAGAEFALRSKVLQAARSAAQGAAQVPADRDKEMLEFAGLAILRRRERMTLRDLLAEFKANRSAAPSPAGERTSTEGNAS